MSLQLHDDGLGMHCFACGRGGTVLDVIAALHGLAPRGVGFARVVELGEQLAGILHGEPPAPKRPQTRSMPERVPPPVDEVRRVWASARPVIDDNEVAAWLQSRAIPVDRVAERDLARVVDGEMPRWAFGPGGAWTATSHRLVLPTFDERGALVSLHARRISDGAGPKTLWPAGHRAVGIFADSLGRLLLRGDNASGGTVVVSEGVPDFLTLATVYGDDESCPAVLGIAAGTWSPGIARRIPDGARVVLAGHGDAAGAKYNDAIAKSLADRCVDVEVVQWT